jgi:demethylmenaquinone methyltransferase/2-methoxy-6-polyprenyl-1,4-benzoquinol methylase
MPYRLPPREEKSRYVRGKFDEIARAYDLFNDLITQGQHRRWKRILVRRLGIVPGDRGLDLCCGTGDIALRCLPGLGAAGGLVAADFSPNMLRIARGRLRQAVAAAPWLALCGDAMRLPFADGAFRFVTVGYGLRNVSDLGGCLAEIRRVLRPGGVLATLDVGRVRPPWLRPLSDFYMFQVVPRIGRLLQRGQDMFAYLPHSTLDYPDQDALKRVLEGSGFERVEVLEFLFGNSVVHVARKAGPPT